MRNTKRSVSIGQTPTNQTETGTSANKNLSMDEFLLNDAVKVLKTEDSVTFSTQKSQYEVKKIYELLLDTKGYEGTSSDFMEGWAFHCQTAVAITVKKNPIDKGLLVAVKVIS